MKKIQLNKVALMGGTFDPIHLGHLFAAERVREEFNLDCIFFIPAGIPSHKSYKEMASSNDRYKMTESAIDSNPYFEISDIELRREGYSYTIDTVNQMKKLLSPDCKLYFIIGTDNAGEILSWKRADELIREIEFIVVIRPGESEETFKDELVKVRNNGGTVNVLKTPMVPIKSTEIRERVNKGKSIRYMVPKEIQDYIQKNKLYRN